MFKCNSKHMIITKEKVDYLANQIKIWFDDLGNGRGCKAIIGISGGKDSTVAAALCVKALGKERVLGVLMPNGEQQDIDDSYAVCKELGIDYIEFNISAAYGAIVKKMDDTGISPSSQTMINLAPRLRMVTLYAISQSVNGRVINTSNLSESYVGYSTQWGDNVGDLAVLLNFTKSEVVQIGDILGISKELVHKVPSDGLSGKTDEDKLGFTYEILDQYIRGEITSKDIPTDIYEKILIKHKNNEFKRNPIAVIQ